ncbi:MAG: hypothetical protein ABI321_11120 [Polyangia bacterium]
MNGKLRQLVTWEGGLALVWLLLTIVALVPVWSQRLLPMLDTPSHLALARGWHSFHDPAFHIADFYNLRIRPVPYLAFYATIDLLMYAMPIELANKVFLSAYLVLFPLSILSVARAFGRSPWLALGAFPLAFNQNWIYGFSSFLMSVALSGFALAQLLYVLREPTTRRALGLGALCVLAYAFHILPWAMFGLGAIVLLWMWRRSVRAIVVAAVAMAPSVLLALYAIWDDRVEGVYMKGQGGFEGVFKSFPAAVGEWPRRVMELFPGRIDGVVLAVLVVTTLALLWWRGAKGAPALVVLLVLMGLEYVTLPYSISKPMSWWFVSPRIPSMMAPLLLLLPSGTFTGKQRLVFLPVVVAGLVLPLQLSRLYRSFSRRNASFMNLCDHIPDGASTFVDYRGMVKGKGSAERSGDPATAGPVYWHFGSWPMALHGGFGAHIFDQGIPIRPKQKSTAPVAALADSFTFRAAPEFDYYLVRDAPEYFDREPSVEVVEKRNDWTLYHRTHAMTEEP